MTRFFSRKYFITCFSKKVMKVLFHPKLQNIAVIKYCNKTNWKTRVYFSKKLLHFSCGLVIYIEMFGFILPTHSLGSDLIANPRFSLRYFYWIHWKYLFVVVSSPICCWLFVSIFLQIHHNINWRTVPNRRLDIVSIVSKIVVNEWRLIYFLNNILALTQICMNLRIYFLLFIIDTKNNM